MSTPNIRAAVNTVRSGDITDGQFHWSLVIDGRLVGSGHADTLAEADAAIEAKFEESIA